MAKCREWLGEAAAPTAPGGLELRLVVGNLPAGVEQGELIDFLNGAVVAATNNCVESCLEVAPCAECLLDGSGTEALITFRTCEGASAALALTGLEFRGAGLLFSRPQEYKASGAPAGSSALEGVTAAALTGLPPAGGDGKPSAADDLRWCEPGWCPELNAKPILKPRVPTDYEILGIPVTHDMGEVRQAFIRLSRACHPNRPPKRDEPAATVGEAATATPAPGPQTVPAGAGNFHWVFDAYAALRGGCKNAAGRPKKVLDRLSLVKAAIEGDLSRDLRVCAFALRHVAGASSQTVQQIEIDAKYAAAIGRAQHYLRETSGADVLVLNPVVGDRADVLLAGKPTPLEQVQALITRYIAEIAELKVPNDGVVVVVPAEMLREHVGTFLTPVRIQKIWTTTQTSVRCVDDRVIVRGPRVPHAVALVQAHLQWQGDIVLFDNSRLDAWSYAYLSECAQGAPDPSLVPTGEPTLGAVRCVLALATAPGGALSQGAYASAVANEEPLPPLAAKTFQAMATGGLRLAHAVLRVAVSTTAFREVLTHALPMQALYICMLLRLWIGSAIRLPLEAFARHPLTVAMTELRALLLDPHSGMSVRVRGYDAVREMVPQLGEWLSWETALAAGGKIVVFLRDVLAWLGERRPSLGLEPAQWAEIPAIAAMVLWICLGGEWATVDISLGVKRLVENTPAPARAPTRPPQRTRSRQRSKPAARLKLRPRSRSRRRRRHEEVSEEEEERRRPKETRGRPKEKRRDSNAARSPTRASRKGGLEPELLDGVEDPVEPVASHCLDAPYVACICFARLLLSLAEANAGDLRDVYVAVKELASVGGIMPSVVAAISQMPALLEAARTHADSRLETLDFLKLLLLHAKMGPPAAVSNNMLDSWVDAVEALAFQCASTDAGSSGEEDGHPSTTLVQLSRRAGASHRLRGAQSMLGPLWLEVILTCSTRLYWAGHSRILLRPPQPRLATQLLAEAIAAIPKGALADLKKGEDWVDWPPALLVHCDRYGELMETVGGTYIVCGENHGRNVYKRTAPRSSEFQVLLYFWDDGDSWDAGWWFGTEIGSDTVWGHHPSKGNGTAGPTQDVDPEPPRHGWEWLGAENDVQLTVLCCRPDEPVQPGRTSGGASAEGSDTEPEEEKAQPQGAGHDGHWLPRVEARCAEEINGKDEAGLEYQDDHSPGDGPAARAYAGTCETSPVTQADAPQLKRCREADSPGRRDALREWLDSLDEGQGCMLQYFDVLATEFEADLTQIAAVRCEGRDGQGLLSQVDPMFWEIVNVRKMGHRMLFARGIARL